ncbi:MAG: 6-carboxytetrahydropterin synthase QueD [Armatimonadetes bacterium]|nr:6-carboxytetrahydropterin synthase QueD [Armatimonadota bacterium]
MFEVGIRDEFAAAHAIRDYNGPCERIHGHNYRVEVVVAARETDARGIVVDFRDLKALVRSITEELDHRLLNELPAFDNKSPTSETIALYIYSRLSQAIAGLGLQLRRVTVWETERAWASYSEDT